MAPGSRLGVRRGAGDAGVVQDGIIAGKELAVGAGGADFGESGGDLVEPKRRAPAVDEGTVGEGAMIRGEEDGADGVLAGEMGGNVLIEPLGRASVDAGVEAEDFLEGCEILLDGAGGVVEGGGKLADFRGDGAGFGLLGWRRREVGEGVLGWALVCFGQFLTPECLVEFGGIEGVMEPGGKDDQDDDEEGGDIRAGALGEGRHGMIKRIRRW